MDLGAEIAVTACSGRSADCEATMKANAERLPKVAPGAEPLEALRAKIMGMERPQKWNGPGSRAIGKAACAAAVNVVLATQRVCEGFPLPRVGPSQLGGVSLQWKFGDVHYMIRVSSGVADRVYFQKEGPGFQQESGTVSRDRAVAALIEIGKSDAGNGKP
jgi:hypothetical protein